MKSTIVRLGLVALAVSALVGCSGGGSDGLPGTPGTPGTQGPTGSGISLATLPAAQWAQLELKGEITGVTVNSPPEVTFTLKDASGNPITGLETISTRASTALAANYPNLGFSIAKLVPGTAGSPSKWVSYIVTTMPTTTTTTVGPTRPSTDNTGTLEALGNGQYKYKFYRDIKQTKAIIDATTDTATAKKADLGDLTYDPNLIHRVGIQIAGSARGTGSNTADASASGVPDVKLKTPVNFFYDFVPATGLPVPANSTQQREIVNVASCFECHSKFVGFHGSNAAEALQGIGASRQNTKMCVLCHTDQRKWGRGATTTTATGYSGSLYRIGGKADGNSTLELPTFIHMIHMGSKLTKTGYSVGGVALNDIHYPQPVQNCTKCHDGTAGAKNQTAQGDNWKKVPNRASCGACHDGVDFATGTGKSLKGTTFSHLPGPQADDSNCATCHGAAQIPVYHTTVDPTGANGRAGYPLNTAQDVPTPGFPSGQGPSIPLASQLNLPAGVYKIDLQLKQVTVTNVTGGRQAKVTYRIMKDGVPAIQNATGFLFNGIDGTPEIRVAYAVPQDGIAEPADWNASVAATVKDIRDKKSGSSQTGPDSEGYYTATLGTLLPANAKMVTAAFGVAYNGFVQKDHASYPQGIRLREPKFARMNATGETARRTIVAADKCNNCHGQLGVSPSFHGGARNNGEGCATGGCHDANKNTGHGGGWSVASKNLIHGIHGGKKRAQAYSYGATEENTVGFQEVEYPGVLRNCEQCHVPGSYDYSAAANAAAVPNMLWFTDTKLDERTSHELGLSPWLATLGRGLADYTADNLVSSPIASSCFGCHDSTVAITHMQQNGGTLVSPASTVSTGARPKGASASPAQASNTLKFTKTETCLVCHGTGNAGDIKVVHSK